MPVEYLPRKMKIYKGFWPVPDNYPDLPLSLEKIEDKFREYGSANKVIAFEVQAEDDWDLLTLLNDLQTELASWDIDLELDKENIHEGEP